MPTKKISPTPNQLPVPAQLIERRIYVIREQKVMLDFDLAELYQVEARALLQAVKRNIDRFPEDFMFQLSAEEAEAMRSQFVIASKRNVRFRPDAFTELRRRHAVQRASQQARRAGQHRDHARLCETARDAAFARRVEPEVLRARTKADRA